jgi:hypothetical protein
MGFQRNRNLHGVSQFPGLHRVQPIEPSWSVALTLEKDPCRLAYDQSWRTFRQVFRALGCQNSSEDQLTCCWIFPSDS